MLPLSLHYIEDYNTCTKKKQKKTDDIFLKFLSNCRSADLCALKVHLSTDLLTKDYVWSLRAHGGLVLTLFVSSILTYLQ